MRPAHDFLIQYFNFEVIRNIKMSLFKKEYSVKISFLIVSKSKKVLHAVKILTSQHQSTNPDRVCPAPTNQVHQPMFDKVSCVHPAADAL